MFFTADQPLANGATHGGLYAYDEDNEPAAAARRARPGRPATPVPRHHPHRGRRRRIYFVSDRDAGSADATAGQPNLFVAGDGGCSSSPTLSIGRLVNLWLYGEFANQASMSRDGRRLAFTS